MNSPTASSVNSIAESFQAIVEVLANGQVAAWVSEFQDSKVIAAVGVASRQENRTMAILELEKVLKKRLESIERVVIEVDSSRETLLLGQTLCYREQNVQSIDTLPSIPADDQYFRELMAETFRAERELDDENPTYTVNWQKDDPLLEM